MKDRKPRFYRQSGENEENFRSIVEGGLQSQGFAPSDYTLTRRHDLQGMVLQCVFLDQPASTTGAEAHDPDQ